MVRKICNFENFTKEIISNNWNVHGAELYEDGKLTHSFGDCMTKYPIYSATKTVLSLAVGIARDEGKIDLTQSVQKYIPEKYLTDSASFPVMHIPLYRLLTMSVKGFPFRPEGDSFLCYSLSQKLENWETPEFDYSNIPAYLAGVALSQAIGGDVWDFIDHRILKPLCIFDAEYTRCPDGFFYGASGMKLSVSDLSKIGLLLYNGGVFEGQRIVSEDYVKKATSIQQMNREGGYGYFICKYKDGFSINGKWGQKCYILPQRKLMITFLGDLRESSSAVRKSMERNLNLID